MALKLYQEESVQAIANAIRAKNGTSNRYKVSEMAGAINAIPEPSGTKNITSNGIYDIANYASVDVNVSGGGSDDDFAKLVDGSIVTANIPLGATKVRKRAFMSCNALQNVVLPTSVTRIEESGFDSCEYLVSVSMPNTLTGIDKYAFDGDERLVTIDLSHVRTIGESAFRGCYALRNITLDSISAGGSSMFSGCSALESVVISSTSIITIPNYAFNMNTSLLSVDLSSSVNTIGYSAFQSCTSLMSITCRALTPPTVNSSAFLSVPATANIYVPASSVETYKTASGWSDRASYIQAIPA